MAADNPEGADHWQDIQLFAFTRWLNSHIQIRGYRVTNLQEDLRNGVILIQLLEVISGRSLGKWNRHPRINAQKVENLQLALDFIKASGAKLEDVSPTDIADGSIRGILNLLWALIQHFIVAGEDLLEWVRDRIPAYDIKGWKRDWNDGRAVCALVDALLPATCPGHQGMDAHQKLDNCARGIRLAQERLAVAPLLTAGEMANPRVDEKSVMAYIAQFRKLAGLARDQAQVNALNTFAHGSGLLADNVAGQQACFWVDVRTSQEVGELRIEVSPAGDEPQQFQGEGCSGRGCVVELVEATTEGRRFRVVYTPAEPGLLRIAVTLGGVPIPGSEFQVTVLRSESLGGEGKIRVFFSTTSSQQKGRADFLSLQRLFESKKIHLRKDFEPWIAIDLLEKEDREAVFRKAGTRKSPLIFIDDVYGGDYDAMQTLADLGKLDEVLAMGKAHDLVSAAEHAQRMRQAAAGGLAQQDQLQQLQQPRQHSARLATGGRKEERRRRDPSSSSSASSAAVSAAKNVAKRRSPGSPDMADKVKASRPEEPSGPPCGRCDKSQKPGVKFCFDCGAKMGAAPARHFCGDCGAELEAGDAFCGGCGTPQ